MNSTNKISKLTDKSSEANITSEPKVSKLSYAWNPTSHLFIKERKTWGQSIEARAHCLAIGIICVPMCLWNGIMVPATIILCATKTTLKVYSWITYKWCNGKRRIRFPYDELANMNQLKGHSVKCVAYLVGTLAIFGVLFPQQAKTLHEKLGLIQQISVLSNIKNVSQDVFHLMANSYLDFSDYASLMQTCSSLNKAGNQSLMKWKANPFATDKTIKGYTLFLEKLCLHSNSKLEKISLKEIQEKTSTTFENVREFEVFYHKSIHSQYIRNLNSLKINFNTDEHIQNSKIATNSPNLKCLEFNISKDLNQTYYFNLFSNLCHNIETFSIKFNKWDSSFYEIAKFYNLKYLEFRDFSFEVDTYSFKFNSLISSIAMCPKLEKITFQFLRCKDDPYPYYSYSSYEYRDLKLFIDALNQFKKFPELKEIEIHGVTNTDYDLFQLLEYPMINNICVIDRYQSFRGKILYDISIHFQNPSSEQ